MRFFLTFFGSEDLFFRVLPLLYWSVDARLGLRVGLALVTTDALVFLFKLIFAAARPYWVSMQVQAYTAESSFGIPSGHAQHAVAIWGIMASGVRKPWAWLLAFTLAFLIGFSRNDLGVHFVHDVLAGWLIGGLLLWAFIRLWDSVGGWLKGKTLDQQLAIAFGVSLIFLPIGVASVARWRAIASRRTGSPVRCARKAAARSRFHRGNLELGRVTIRARGRGALVVFSFQIGRAAQWAVCRSVIIPKSRA